MAWTASLAHTVRKGFHTERVFADPWAIGRAVLAVAISAALGWARDDLLATTMMSVGAFICGIGTLLAPLRHRLVNASVMALAFSGATALGVFLQPTGWYFLIALSFAAFLAGLWRALGAAPGIRACLVVIGMLITADVSPGIGAGLEMVEWIAAGSGLVVLVHLLPPYGRRHAAQRRKLADVYASLADYARREGAMATRRTGGAVGPQGAAASVSPAPFSAARTALGLLPPYARPAAAPLFGLLGEAERVRRALYAAQGARDVPYEALAAALDALARTIAAGRHPRPAAKDPAVGAPAPPALHDWQGPLADTLRARLAEARRLAALAVTDAQGATRPDPVAAAARDAVDPSANGSAPVAAPAPSSAVTVAAAAPHEEIPALYRPEGLARGGLRRLTAELSPRLTGAPLLRHALRVGIGTTVGEAAGRALGDFWGHGLPAHGFWAALTTMLVLFPDYQHTFARGWSRPVGSIAGGFLAWGLLQFSWSHGALALATVAFAAVTFVVLRTGQHTLNLVLTAWIVFLLHQMGTAQNLVAWGRPADTVLGAAIALAIFLVLPTWHHHRIPDLLARWLRTQQRLLPALLTGYTDAAATDRATLEQLRGAARRAREELESAIGHLSHEPRGHRARWSVAELRRITSSVFAVTRCTALLREHLPVDSTETVPELAEFAAPLQGHLAALEELAANGKAVRPGELRALFTALSAKSGLAWVADPAAPGTVSTPRARALATCLRTVLALESLTADLTPGPVPPSGPERDPRDDARRPGGHTGRRRGHARHARHAAHAPA
ncbi:FUSC family protein [Streptomyces diacarni]|uniref:FUSC family protein n=1 Tax=Streptomyces diacarni TaxID=2800381 RepID=UPI00340B3BCF